MLATSNIQVRLIDQPPDPKGVGNLLCEARKGDRYILPERPVGCCAQNVPVPFSGVPPCWLPEWPLVFARGLGHQPFLLAAYEREEPVGQAFQPDAGRTIEECQAGKPDLQAAQTATLMLRGYLPLCLVTGLFGRFLVSLPYLNAAGVLAADDAIAWQLIDAAVELADRLDVRYLELRHERRIEHPSLLREMTGKVHMRLPLPQTADDLWNRLKAKVRNQVRKGREQGFEVFWSGTRTRSVSEERTCIDGVLHGHGLAGASGSCGGDDVLHDQGLAGASGWYGGDLLEDFYDVFSRNMRDLGTPVFGRRLFRAVIEMLPEHAELCVVRDGRRPVAAALVVHGEGITEVPSASALRSYNPTNVNMLMYWHLLQRAIERGQQVFDFGRSTVDSGTFQFKKQWGAEPHPAVWQYYVRRGDVGDVRPDNARYRAMIRIWQRLPIWLTRAIGPAIVRGIP